MKRFFGTEKSQPQVSENALGEASSKMDATLQDLDAKIARCDEDLKRQMASGRGANKQVAMQTMKRKKMYEQQRSQLLGTQFNIDSLAFAQEQAATTALSIQAMKAGQQKLKQQYAAMNVGDVERLMDEMADLQGDAQEIQEMLAQNYAVPDGFDEAEFEQEFAQLEEEMKMDQLYGKPAYLSAPAPAAPAPAAASGVAAAEQPAPAVDAAVPESVPTK
mmetsp:Transcript_10520/g.19060  ORF Transcript_10520/g.19060 Transcript_10520/m.19060 type:complete len:219 (-) Transcript_10520:60-716(-)